MAIVTPAAAYGRGRPSLIALLLLAFVAFAATCAGALPAAGNRVLLLLPKAQGKNTYSGVVRSLQDRQFKLDVVSGSEAGLTLWRFQERLYDHILLMASTINPLSAVELVSFVKDGGNVLVATYGADRGLRDALWEFGFEMAGKDESYVDLFATSKNDTLAEGCGWMEGHIVRVRDHRWRPHRYVDHFPKPGKRALLRGTSTSIVLPAAEDGTSLSFSSLDEPLDPFASGRDISLISTFETRNNARITVVGSASFLSNDVWNTNEEMREFAEAVLKWTFKEDGVIRVKEFRHWDTADPRERQMGYYFVERKLGVEVELEAWSDGIWKPFVPTDAQFEAVMMETRIRQPLKPYPPGNATKLRCTFTFPDTIGIFTFLFDYRRPFFTHLTSSQVVAMRQRRQDQQERLSVVNGPYYVTIALAIVGWVMFTMSWVKSWGFVRVGQGGKKGKVE